MKELINLHPLITLLANCVLMCRSISCVHSFADENADATILYYEVNSDLLPDGLKIDRIGTASLLTTLSDRLGTMGRLKISDNGQIEVYVNGGLDQAELNSIKLRISASGYVEFRYTADSERTEDRLIIEQARSLPPDKRNVVIGVITTAEWVAFSENECDPAYVKDHRLVKRLTHNGPETQILMDSLHLTGEYLASVQERIDEHGRRAMELSFNGTGSSLLRELTSKEKNNTTREHGRFLGLLLDKQLVGGTPIRKTLDKKVQIGGMTEHEINAVIAIINAGALPYPLKELR